MLDTFNRNIREMVILKIMSVADLVVEPCHPIRSGSPSPIRDLALVLKTSHLVFSGGIARATLSLCLVNKKKRVVNMLLSV
jgi:hypothetical protein